MSAIDDVIQRSRQPGGFVEHKRFTVARSRAIEKMRKFALADPRFYVLELIQAAVANGADYVDLELRKSEVILSYVGGGFSEEELGQLFDFLFASKEQLEFADIRQLALGINALLLGRPDEVVIESGDGTAARTTRVRIDGRSEAIEVGRPHQPLRGTYVRASGVNRAALGGLVELGEQSAIEQRCLTAPVPIFVNSEPLFGYGASRTPKLLGYQSWLAFDEGDLYGAIGISRWEEDQVFKLLTFGVWIDTVRADILPGTPLGGIVCFDRLHKTADHAAIVQDERLQELWHRLRPYARQLREGRVGSKARDVWLLDGTRLETTRLREILRRFPTVLAIDPPLPAPSTGSARRAVAISTALNAPVLCLPPEDIATLRSLGGEKLRVLHPDVRDDTEVAFYQQPTTEPPARPWVIAPVEVAPLPVPALVERLEQAGFLRNTIPEPPAAEGQRLVAALGAAAELKATVYVPEQTQHSTELRIDLVVTNRRVWTETVPSAWPGCVLRVELPDVSPRVVLRPSPSQPGTSFAAHFARTALRHAAPALDAAARRVVDGLVQTTPVPGSTAARIALATLARSALKRLRRDAAGRVVVRFSTLDPTLPEALLDAPLFRTVDGQAHSLRDLELTMEATGGLVYGVLAGSPADLAGLDPSRILALDPQQERLLVTLLGEASYVRIDARDVLAEYGGIRCRDFAFGLRPWYAFPLLVEGEDPNALPPAERTTCEQTLVRRLVRVFTESPTEELRRQAARHLLWYLYRSLSAGSDGAARLGVTALPLFLDVDGQVLSFDDIRPALARPEGLAMHDGWSTDVADLGPLGDAAARTVAQPPGRGSTEVRGLPMNPFVFHLLSRLGNLRPAFDFDLTDAEAIADPRPPVTAFALQLEVRQAGLSGVVGIPAGDVADPAIAVLDTHHRRVGRIRGPGAEAGVVGYLHLTADDPGLDLHAAAAQAVVRLMGRLAARLVGADPAAPETERLFRAALAYAARKVLLIAQPGGTIAVQVVDGAAEQILDLPVFPTSHGAPVSAMVLLHEYAAVRSATLPEDQRTKITDSTPPLLQHWLADVLRDGRIVRPGPVPGSPADRPPGLSGHLDHAGLGRWLTAALARLQPELQVQGRAWSIVVRRPREEEARRGIALIRVPVPLPLQAMGQLAVDADHWLVVRALRDGGKSIEALAWLLLACFAQLNEGAEDVTNAQELAFQGRVLELLERGTLPDGAAPAPQAVQTP